VISKKDTHDAYENLTKAKHFPPVQDVNAAFAARYAKKAYHFIDCNSFR